MLPMCGCVLLGMQERPFLPIKKNCWGIGKRSTWGLIFSAIAGGSADGNGSGSGLG